MDSDHFAKLNVKCEAFIEKVARTISRLICNRKSQILQLPVTEIVRRQLPVLAAYNRAFRQEELKKALRWSVGSRAECHTSLIQ